MRRYLLIGNVAQGARSSGMSIHGRILPPVLRTVSVCCSMVLLLWPLRAQADSPQILTRIQQVRELPPEQAGQGYPVKLQGVVTAISGWKNSFFLQDASADISVDRDSGEPAVEAGQRIELDGVTAAAKFARILKATHVQVLGAGTLPKPRAGSIDLLPAGTLDSQWTAVHGFVRTAIVTKVWDREVLVLEMDLGGGTLVTANVREFSGDTWHHLPGSIVSIRGVCGTIFNDRRQYLRARFFVNSLRDITVLRAGPADFFDRAPIPVSGIGRFSSGVSRFEPVKIRGTLTSVQTPDRVYVQSGTEGVLVHTNSPVTALRGSSVEVVGFARDGDYAPSLEGAVLHLTDEKKSMPAALTINAGKAIVDKDGFPSAPYDALLIHVTGTLSQIIQNPDEQVLLLRSGDTFFGAVLPKSATMQSFPEIGSVLAVNGVCFTRVNAAHEPTGFRVLLQSESDITVLRGASWWTAEHAKEAVAGMAIALLLMASLLFFYRRESALRELSFSDPLTGVYNRRGFVLLAAQEWRQALRNKESMELFYIDVDDFKTINDTLGHKQGDLALQTVATILRDCFRGSDIVGRLGGDEFAVVACNASSRSSLKERLANMVEQSNRASGSAFQLALSVGVLQCDASLGEFSIEDLLTRADTLMYGNKTKRKSEKRSAAPMISMHGV